MKGRLLLAFPGYTYSEEERQQITQAMEKAYQEVLTQIDEADDYQKVMVVYTYIIDNTDYVVSQDDQSIAGTGRNRQFLRICRWFNIF
ncbi:MAG: hypothetical protein ACLUTA_17670 [Blautia wexlerae]